MPYLVKISMIGCLLFSLVFCTEKNKAKKELSNLDFYLEKGFVSDTISYGSMYFKMRIYNRGSNAAHLFLEKHEVPQANEFNRQPLVKNGSIFIMDSAGKKLNELLLWPLFPAEITINPKKQVDFILIGSLKGLVNAGYEMRPDVSTLQKALQNKIRTGPYYYYSLNDKGEVNDSAAIHVDKNFLITYRAPMVGD